MELTKQTAINKLVSLFALSSKAFKIKTLEGLDY